MNVRIQETGELRDLTIRDRGTGIEWTQDLVSADTTIEDEMDEDDWPTGNKIAPQDTYDWWESHIAEREAMEDAIADAKERGLPADVLLDCQMAYGDDDEYGPAYVISAIREALKDATRIGNQEKP